MRKLTFDAMKKSRKQDFKPKTSAEIKFARALKKVAKVASHIIGVHIDGVTIRDDELMMKRLKEYAVTIEPWAERQSAIMLEKVQTQNARAYKKNSQLMGKLIQTNTAETKTGEVARKLLKEQVGLIQSIPIEAGLRAQRIAMEAALQGRRAVPDKSVIDELKNQLDCTDEVATNRAQLIAVTETARSNASLNQARAQAVGSNTYIWRNSGDGAVREAHEHYHGPSLGGTEGTNLDGKIFSWEHPPTLDDGTTGHPGTFPRCRCYAEPIF